MALEPEMLEVTQGVLNMTLEVSEAGSETPGGAQETLRELSRHHYLVWQDADFIVLHVEGADNYVVWDFREDAPGGMVLEEAG